VTAVFFSSPRLIARRFEERDLEHLLAMRADPEVAAFQSWEKFTPAEGREFLAWVGGRNPGDPGWFQFALEHREAGGFIGDCGLRIMEIDNRLAQVGYTIRRAHWNMGYATEAVTALLAYAFSTFDLHRIAASVDPRNAASCRVLEKVGFRKEGHFIESEWFKGEWADDAVYGLLRSEWRRPD
jgi:[ribosomal protein S5]-alanine N-acetyltransferase